MMFKTITAARWMFSTNKLINGVAVCAGETSQVSLTNFGIVQIPQNCKLNSSGKIYYGSKRHIQNTLFIPNVQLHYKLSKIFEIQSIICNHIHDIGQIGTIIGLVCVILYLIICKQRNNQTSQESTGTPITILDPTIVCQFTGPSPTAKTTCAPPAKEVPYALPPKTKNVMTLPRQNDHITDIMSLYAIPKKRAHRVYDTLRYCKNAPYDVPRSQAESVIKHGITKRLLN